MPKKIKRKAAAKKRKISPKSKDVLTIVSTENSTGSKGESKLHSIDGIVYELNESEDELTSVSTERSTDLERDSSGAFKGFQLHSSDGFVFELSDSEDEHTIASTENSKGLKRDSTGAIKDEIKSEIADEVVFSLMEELEGAEKVDGFDEHTKFFEDDNTIHDKELNGFGDMKFITSSMIDELPVQVDEKEIIEGVQSMYPRFGQDVQKFYKQKKETKDALDNIFVLLKESPNDDDYAADPEGLDIALMPHQKRALKWMTWREMKKPYGGILADDMGLGKTLSMISLIMQEKNSLFNDESDDDWNLSHGGTLVICPTSLLRQWEREIISKTECAALMPLVFYGEINKKDLERLRSFDIVITTYHTVCGLKGHYLRNLIWRRIILDEAHVIRNIKTKTHNTICSLKAKHRWVLTGTPIHNKEEDVYALLKFLNYRPFDDKSCWNTWLKDHKRLSVVVRSAMLRRTKSELLSQSSIFRLPAFHEENFEIQLSDEEMLVHHTVLSFSRVLFDKFLRQREERRAAAQNIQIIAPRDISVTSKDHIEFLHKLQGDEHNIGSFVILVLLLRLRQICCHPGLIQAILNDDGETKKKNIDEGSSLREILNLHNNVYDLKNPSTKIKRVLEILKPILKTGDKVVIVSQWKQYLDILEDHIQTLRIKVLKFHGSMNIEERAEVLQNFQSPGEFQVLLLSMTCGGVGLNLTSANHIFFLEPHWNPQMEAQAQDRIYRMGQTKEVYVYKFICSNSVEERIQEIQKNKLEISKNVLTGAAAVNSVRLTINDLKKLFGMIDQFQKS